MCLTMPHRHSIFCLVPPHVLDSIARNGSSNQRNAALKTLSTDNTFRALRISAAAQPLAGQRRRGALAVEGQKQRTIYTARNEEVLPGTAIRAEGAPATGDAAVDEAYDGLGHTFDFFWEVYSRNSIDDEGMPLDATVHYGRDYDNAFWNGERMVFGDGDGQLFNRFTVALDVIGHELAHGVTEDEAQLRYFLQSGALNESMSDVFGSLIKQKILGQKADEADWLIGAGLLAAGVQGKALRSMSEPGSAYDDPVLGKDPQPGHMDDYVRTNADNGGVHINSGIPNRAFYLAATALGGYAWEKAGRIWYETLRDARVRPNTGFTRFASLTVDVAGRLYGSQSSERQAVAGAWAEVGVIETS
ncbi:MAG: peptidase thermolysin [Geminicoccaceae bacterium]|jgi:Zn-dependent metalloprotease|nr:peptidase thermolysin [Geminicoccaceae bacterium]